MIIREIFEDDINRNINGVVKVTQDDADVLVQELEEYVITRDLKKHFATFFQNYSQSFQVKTSDIGVWISGFFGSGKSHFLKMLSYLLANREVQGIRTVDRFQKKFQEDPETYRLIQSVTQGQTDTILFNIDTEGSIHKDNTAVLRVFAKMFYNYLGFYGEDLKLAKLEQHIENQGKTEEFRRVFEEKNGESWLDSRDSYVFFEDDIAETLQEVLGMSEEASHNWFNGSETVETSIAKLVSEIREYVEQQPEDFRLLFMVDEVGQYVGSDTSLLINLQSLVEEIGSKCGGKVWVVCTGQEAIDEIIKTRTDEFSRIQARFKTRLSLTSSSADEVIQKRILKKTPAAEQELKESFQKNDSVLRNLFSFTSAMSDIKGYEGEESFTVNYPFIPYQFIIMQKVFAEIRKHGNSGKHLSGGERSMLSGFQEAAQRIQDRDGNALVPFYYFYDTVHGFLDSSIRNVIERCQQAADNRAGIHPEDVDVLKLLYLVRYIPEDLPANLDNIVILMSDDIRMDKVIMREKMRNSLDRLVNQNYIGRDVDTYKFLTDEEQDIQREIYTNTQVDTADIVNQIGAMIYGEIYPSHKFRYGQTDFAFDRKVDGYTYGSSGNGMELQILTVATDEYDKEPLKLATRSKRRAIMALAETSYFESLENVAKVKKYVKQQDVSRISSTAREIIQKHQNLANKYQEEAKKELQEAIANADLYVDGDHLSGKSRDAKGRIDQALEYLIRQTYSELHLINKNYESDQDIREILRGDHKMGLEMNGVAIGTIPNQEAENRMEEFLEVKYQKNFPVTMEDIQKNYQNVPYGWREIDIAAVAAMLIYDQKVTIKYSGETIRPDNPKLPDMLRKRTETGRTRIQKRQIVSEKKLRQAREFLREYLEVMDVPADEDGLVAYIVERFTKQHNHYLELEQRYRNHKYPDYPLVKEGIKLTESVLSQQKDNMSLVDRLIERGDDLLDNKEDMVQVEDFFSNQVQIFDEAAALDEKLRNDRDQLSRRDEEAHQALNQIRKITQVESQQKTIYRRVPELNELMKRVKESHQKMLQEKREEILEVVRQCMSAVHSSGAGHKECNDILDRADRYFDGQKKEIQNKQELMLLDGLVMDLWNMRDRFVNNMEDLKRAAQEPKVPNPTPKKSGDGTGTTEAASLHGTEHKEERTPVPPKKVYRSVHKASFPAATLETEADVDSYVENIRNMLLRMMKDQDGIKLK